MTLKLNIGLTLIAAAIAIPVTAHATPFMFDFSGPGVSGTLNLSYETNPNVGVLPGTSPNPVDPVGSYVITGVAGTFSDALLGLSNVAITGITPLNKVSPEASNLLAPNSFSLLPVANGVASPGGLSLGLHYDNLFYPAGSPQAASDYPFHGGVFDIYGLVFTVAGGNYVNFWSNGVGPSGGLDYGVAVTDGVDVLDYTGGVTISAAPEPATWAMMIVGFGMIGLMQRRRQRIRISYG